MKKTAKCLCGAPMTEIDKHNAGLCIPCWTYDATVNHQSNIKRV